jgi:hypothetical protein
MVNRTLSRSTYWIVVLAVVCGCLSVLATTTEEIPGISWDQASPLTWDLFRGMPPADSAGRITPALIAVEFGWHASFSARYVHGAYLAQVDSIEVTVKLLPSRSWVNRTLATDHILQHEQLHFDLYEVYRRKLLTLMCGVGSCSAATEQSAYDQLSASLSGLFYSVSQSAEATQALYDAQTGGSVNREEQARWKELIASWLMSPMAAP